MSLETLSFELVKPTITLNQLLALRAKGARSKRGGDWAVQAHKKALAWEIKLALLGRLPVTPFARAELVIERLSLQEPDPDGLVGGAKLLIDCLLPQGTPRIVKKPISHRIGGRIIRHVAEIAVYPHPHGLGVIADDNAKCLSLHVLPVRVRKAIDQKTIVTIKELKP